MNFIADKQTLEDLNMLGKFKPQSVFSLFNNVQTAGGERLLLQMFEKPFTTVAPIMARIALFRYFHEKGYIFPVSIPVFKKAEEYLSMGSGGNLLLKKAQEMLFRDEQYAGIMAGLQATIALLNAVRKFASGLEHFPQLSKVLDDPRLRDLPADAALPALSLVRATRYHYLFKQAMQQEMDMLLEQLYLVDVCICVSDLARSQQMCYPVALEADRNVIEWRDLRHPALKNGVGNALSLGQAANLLFLTGANMAGKSTFMKSTGIALYLAHMGFPVAAAAMTFSVRDGIFSSINVPDNLNMGYSHYYAEVLRVKQVAESVAAGRNLLVIFDELFKGTNVKDAYEATLAVTTAFAGYRNCAFIISTHIIEVGEALRGNGSIQFSYLPTVMEGHIPRYTYHLTSGISNDRHGMKLIENEKILDLLFLD